MILPIGLALIAWEQIEAPGLGISAFFHDAIVEKAGDALDVFHDLEGFFEGDGGDTLQKEGALLAFNAEGVVDVALGDADKAFQGAAFRKVGDGLFHEDFVGGGNWVHGGTCSGNALIVDAMGPKGKRGLSPL